MYQLWMMTAPTMALSAALAYGPLAMTLETARMASVSASASTAGADSATSAS